MRTYGQINPPKHDTTDDINNATTGASKGLKGNAKTTKYLAATTLPRV